MERATKACRNQSVLRSAALLGHKITSESWGAETNEALGRGFWSRKDLITKGRKEKAERDVREPSGTVY